MKSNLHLLKLQVDELKVKQETLENVVRDVVKRIEVIEKRSNSEKEIEKSKCDETDVMIDLANNYKAAIGDIEEKIEKLEALNKTTKLKKCKFYNRGYCKNLKCRFFHPEKVCNLYIKDGVCEAQDCDYRHPKPCRYWRRGNCTRGQSCAFSQSVNQERNLEQYNCVTCEKESDSKGSSCNLCNANNCGKCTVKMQAWKQDNSELCNFLELPHNLEICVKCLLSRTPRKAVEVFELTRKTLINFPVMHLPKEECQGSGIYRGDFECKQCKENFCTKCILKDHEASEYICLNCAE